MDFKDIPIRILEDNLAVTRAIADGVGIFSSQGALFAAAQDAFNIMVEALDPHKLTLVDAMKISMLNHMIQGHFNIEKIQQSADEHVVMLTKEIQERKNATS